MWGQDRELPVAHDQQFIVAGGDVTSLLLPNTTVLAIQHSYQLQKRRWYLNLQQWTFGYCIIYCHCTGYHASQLCLCKEGIHILRLKHLLQYISILTATSLQRYLRRRQDPGKEGKWATHWNTCTVLNFNPLSLIKKEKYKIPTLAKCPPVFSIKDASPHSKWSFLLKKNNSCHIKSDEWCHYTEGSFWHVSCICCSLLIHPNQYFLILQPFLSAKVITFPPSFHSFIVF